MSDEIDTTALIRELGPHEGFPKAAIERARAHREAAVPAFIEALERATSDELEDHEFDALFLIIHLLGEFRETRAFGPLMRFLADPDELGEICLGDAVTETLSGVIINVFDGDADTLERLIVDPSVEIWTRHALFDAWTYLVANGRIDRERGQRFLTEWSRRPFSQDDDAVWSAWLGSVAMLGFEDLHPAALEVVDKLYFGPVPYTSREGFERLATAAAESADINALLRKENIAPFEDTVATFETWNFPDPDELLGEAAKARLYGYDDLFGDLEEEEEEEAPAPWEPEVNPYRHVGRNDPCPCGSGKSSRSAACAEAGAPGVRGSESR